MKTKLITILMCLCPLLLYAQDYKKEGDELFQQAQYEKAIKKYNAYIAFAGEDPAVSKRIANAEKCNSLLSRAKSAEQVAAESSNATKYEEASRLYSELYSLHPLSSYKSKATQLQNKADAIRIDQERAEQAELERIALERQRSDSIRREAQKERERQEQIRREEERRQYLLRNSNITMKELLDHPLGVANIQWTDNREKLFEMVKNQLENGYTDTLYSLPNSIRWHLFGFVEKELTLYYRVWYVSLDWEELQNGGIRITYEIHWSNPYNSREQEQRKVLEYLKNDIEQYGITFTDTITQRRKSGYYTRKNSIIHSIITYACISKEDYRNISLKILYQLDSRSQTTQRYRVSKGESLSRIAQKYGVSEENILKLNPNVKHNGLSEGLILYIPKK
jgi:hypothetical protein